MFLADGAQNHARFSPPVGNCANMNALAGAKTKVFIQTQPASSNCRRAISLAMAMTVKNAPSAGLMSSERFPKIKLWAKKTLHHGRATTRPITQGKPAIKHSGLDLDKHCRFHQAQGS